MDIFNSFIKKIKADSKDDTKLNMDDWWKQINKKVHEDAVKQEELTGKDYVSPYRSNENTDTKYVKPYDRSVQDELDRIENDNKEKEKYLIDTDYIDLDLLQNLSTGRDDFNIGESKESELFNKLKSEYINTLYDEVVKFQSGNTSNIKFTNNIDLINNKFRQIYNQYLKSDPESFSKGYDFESQLPNNEVDFDFKNPDDKLNIEEINKQKDEYFDSILEELENEELVSDLIYNDSLSEQHFKLWFKSYFDALNSSYTDISKFFDSIPFTDIFNTWRENIIKFILNPLEESFNNKKPIDKYELEAKLKSIFDSTFYDIFKSAFMKFVSTNSKYNEKDIFKKKDQKFVKIDTISNDSIDLSSLAYKAALLATKVKTNEDRLSEDLNNAINNFPKDTDKILLSPEIKLSLRTTVDFFNEPIKQFNKLCNIIKLFVDLKVPMNYMNKDIEMETIIPENENISEEQITNLKKLSSSINSILICTENLKSVKSTFNTFSDMHKDVYVSKYDLQNILQSYIKSINDMLRVYKYVEGLYTILGNDVSNKIRYNV